MAGLPAGERTLKVCGCTASPTHPHVHHPHVHVCVSKYKTSIVVWTLGTIIMSIVSSDYATNSSTVSTVFIQIKCMQIEWTCKFSKLNFLRWIGSSGVI